MIIAMGVKIVQSVNCSRCLTLLSGNGRENVEGIIELMSSLQLGTFGRAKRKVDELQGVIAESRRTGQH